MRGWDESRGEGDGDGDAPRSAPRNIKSTKVAQEDRNEQKSKRDDRNGCRMLKKKVLHLHILLQCVIIIIITYRYYHHYNSYFIFSLKLKHVLFHQLVRGTLHIPQEMIYTKWKIWNNGSCPWQQPMRWYTLLGATPLHSTRLHSAAVQSGRTHIYAPMRLCIRVCL